MKTFQWDKNSHGLFNYDMSQTTKKTYTINNSKIGIRTNNGLDFVAMGTNVGQFGEECQEILKVTKVRNKYFIEGVKPTDPLAS